MKARIKNFRFYEKAKHGKLLSENSYLKSLKEIISNDQGTFELANHFFYLNVNNRQPIDAAKRSLEIEKQIIKFDYRVSEKYSKELINKLLELYNKTQKEFNHIRVQYIEFIIMEWKKIPGRTSKVFNEPEIRYKRKKFFHNTEYCNALCDIVHIDKKRLIFEMYECKTTMKAFSNDLTLDERVESGVKQKSIRRSKRKQNYMSAFYDLINNNSNVKKLEIAYVTLAPQEDLMFTIIGKIPVKSRDDLFLDFSKIFSSSAPRKK